jgi:iron complex transport system permease protein
VVAAVVLLAGLVLVAAASLAIGASDIGLHTVVDAFLRHDPANPDHIAVISKRLPRTVVGLVAGAALGLAGTVAQGVTRNPLADPGILGINQGAALSVVVGIAAFDASSPGQYLWFAFAGAGLAAVLVWLIAGRGRDGATPVKLALAGSAVAATFLSLVSGVLMASQESLDRMRFWQVGSIAGRGFDVLLPALPALLIGSALALLLGRPLNLLALGDDAAHALGLPVNRARLFAGSVVVLLAGAATAVCGPIAFLGLIVPHLVRLATGPDYRGILAFSAPAAALVLLGADVVGRLLARPGEVQVGIVLAGIGAPVFIALVRGRKAVSL